MSKYKSIHEERQYRLDSFFKEGGRFIPEPTYSFQIGDEVCIGNLKNVWEGVAIY